LRGTELGRSLPLLVLFVLGLAAGAWVVVSPWALGFPASTGWTPSVWTSIWVGAIVAVSSAVCLVTLLARALHTALDEGRPGE
jgi:hypothetical protein